MATLRTAVLVGAGGASCLAGRFPSTGQFRPAPMEGVDLSSAQMDPRTDEGSSEVTARSGDPHLDRTTWVGGAAARRDWTRVEVALVVADYLDMYEKHVLGSDYSKSDHRERLKGNIGRSDKSIEFKHCNISAVLAELGLPWLPGYRPLHHYQRLLVEELERRLDRVAVISGRRPEKVCTQHRPDPAAIFVDAPGRRTGEAGTPLDRLVRKFDPAERDGRNRALGLAGEEFVLEVERMRLQAAGRPDLMRKIAWVSRDVGDGAGYDVHSFDPATGCEKLIEVKTTRGGIATPFFLSRTEEAVSRERPDDFHLYRVFEFGESARIFTLRPPLDRAVNLSVSTWSASFR